MPNELKYKKENVLKAVKQNGLELKFAPTEMKNDKEVVIAAIKQNPAAIVYASNELRANKEIAKIAIKKCGLEYDLSSASDAALLTVKVVGPLQYFAKEISYDEQIAFEAVKYCRENYSALPNEFKIKQEFTDAYLAGKNSGLFDCLEK